MTRIGAIGGFLPPETYLLLIVGAGIALVLGSKRIALLLCVIVAAGIFLPPVIEPILDTLPFWLLIVVGIIAGFLILGVMLEFVIGKRSADETKAILAANVIRHIVIFPFRVIGWIFRLVFPRR